MTKRFKSVDDLVDSLVEDKEEAKDTKAFIRTKELARILTVLRNHAGASQQDMARKLSWSQSKVSKLEHLDNKSFTIGDLEDYAGAIDFRIEIAFFRKKMKLADKVKYHFFQMRKALDKIPGLAKKDEDIQKGVDMFMREASLNLFLEAASCLEKAGSSRKAEGNLSIIPPDLPEDPAANPRMALTH